MEQIILLVEDNPDDAELTLRAVHGLTSYEVLVVRDGAEALDFFFGSGDYQGRDLSVRPVLVLLDLKLPKVSGLEVLRRIKQDPQNCIVPVVVFSSSTEELDVAKCYAFGANSYVSKPVDYRRYGACLDKILAYWLGLTKLPLR